MTNKRLEEDIALLFLPVVCFYFNHRSHPIAVLHFDVVVFVVVAAFVLSMTVIWLSVCASGFRELVR